MGIREENIKALELNHEEIYSQLMKRDKGMDVACSVESYPTLNDEKMLIVTKEQQMYRLNSMYNPSHEAKRFVKHINFKNETAPIMLYGFGNGVIVRELLHNCNDSMHLIVYEPSREIFEHVIKEYDVKDILLNTKLSLIVENMNEAEFNDIMYENIGYLNCQICIHLVHPNYLPLFQQSYGEYDRIVKWFKVSLVSNRNTLELLGKQCVTNAIYNLDGLHQAYSFTNLRGKLSSDTPAIIVSAGPSLDKNIQYLKEAKGKSVIIAVDRAMNALLEQGIVPDFSVTLDATKQLKCYEREESNEIPLFYALSGRKEIIKQHKGVKVFYNVDRDSVKLLKELISEETVISAGGSVATVAFSIAVELGSKKIILIGQDLAFSNGKTHAAGADPYKNEEQVMLVPGVVEPLVETIPNLYMYAQWFEKAAKSLSDDYVLIDATEGGALIGGFVAMKLTEAIKTHCLKEFEFSKILHDSLDKKRVGREQVIQLAKRMLEELDTMKEYIEKGQEIYRKSIQELKIKRSNTFYMRNVDKLDRYDDYIYNCLVYGLLDMYTAAYTWDEAKEVNVYEKDEVERHIKVLTKSYNVYRELAKGTKDLMEVFATVFGSKLVL